MKKNFFIIISFIFFIFVFSSKLSANSTDPKKFITEIVNEAKKILVASNTREIKEKKLAEYALQLKELIIEKGFDESDGFNPFFIIIPLFIIIPCFIITSFIRRPLR